MSKILVAYATLSGTTIDVAKIVGEELSSSGVEVDISPLSAVGSLDAYSAVVVGGPMIAGWHRSALGFVARHRRDWQRLPLAVFVTAMSLTRDSITEIAGVPLCIDPDLPKAPARPDRLTFRERYSLVENYARPIVNAIKPARPVSIAFLGGRLDYGRLPWWAVLFAMLIIQAPAGNKHNPAFIHRWAAGLPRAFAVAPGPSLS